jgi:restriction system protein
VTYTSNDSYLDNFQKNHQNFVKNNALPDRNGNKVLIKYYAEVKKTIKKTFTTIPSDKYYIWTRNHVKSYINNNIPYIWILRVYKLKEPYWAEPTPFAIRYANLENEVSLEDKEPVLSDEEFLKILNEI